MKKRKIFVSFIILLLAFSYTISPAFAKGEISTARFKKMADTVSEVEPNDSMAEANQIKPSDEVSAVLADDEDTDYYKLNIPHKGTITLLSYLGSYDWENDEYSQDYSFSLYDMNGNEIEASEYIHDDNYGSFQGMQISLNKGTYYISVKTNGNSNIWNESYYLWNDITYDPDFTINPIKANYPSPQIERKTITIQASANKTGLEYQFSVQGKVVKGYSTSSIYEWTPTAPGTYKIKVEARDPQFRAAVAQKEISYTITAYKPDFAITSFAPNVKSPYLSGKTVTFTAKTNKTGLQYQFSINGKPLQAFGTNSSFKWKPTKSGNYSVKVEVRRAQYPNRVLSKQLSYQIVDGKVYVTSLKANLSSPRPTSTSIRWTAKANGTNLQYKFSIYQNKKWKTIKNYSSKNYAYWKPKTAGSYKVMVTVRSSLSKKTATKKEGFTIYKPSFFSTPTIKANKGLKKPENTHFTFTAKSSGKYLEYRFRVYDGYSWYTVKDYSNSRTLSWTAYLSGKYTVAVDVRQKGTKKVKTKKLYLDIRETPNGSFNADYDIYYNYGYLKVTNYGYSNLKVTKLQFLTGGKVVYTNYPKNWITVGRTYQTFYFYPNKSVTNFTYNSVIKVYYTYDGLSYTSYLYR
ncbi:triple tyrosine motif-containing protein [Bacillus salipaludis]|uniref:triple tyrosine motif-containing protein n=1 Tax=Bacillus salipaludis TaxID=2547811 RepID=UPI002E20F210|nr:triple tyrosine motif-containing protein [Bacillus salipaludis]